MRRQLTAEGSGVGSVVGREEGACDGKQEGLGVGRLEGGVEGSGEGCALGIAELGVAVGQPSSGVGFRVDVTDGAILV